MRTDAQIHAAFASLAQMIVDGGSRAALREKTSAEANAYFVGWVRSGIGELALELGVGRGPIEAAFETAHAAIRNASIERAKGAA
jgi:hypothetical protein